MKKRYIFAFIALVITIIFFLGIITEGDKNNTQDGLPRLGQFLWTYNLNTHEWKKYSDRDDLESISDVIWQTKGHESTNGYTVYSVYTGNSQVSKDDVWLGENTEEFIRNKNLYSYNPKNFELYEVTFNGYKFVLGKVNEKKLETIFKGSKVIKTSELKKGKYVTKYSKNNNKFIIVNDLGDKFYQYYIIPNDSKKMQIGDISNTFKVSEPLDIKLQRLEGCTQNYPCYEIKITE